MTFNSSTTQRVTKCFGIQVYDFHKLFRKKIKYFSYFISISNLTRYNLCLVKPVFQAFFGNCIWHSIACYRLQITGHNLSKWQSDRQWDRQFLSRAKKKKNNAHLMAICIIVNNLPTANTSQMPFAHLSYKYML